MKHKEENKLDNFFKESLENFEIEPSSNVWPGIERQLDAQKKGGARVIMLRLSVAASVILVALFGLNALFVNTPQKQDLATVTIEKDSLKKTGENKIEKSLKVVQPGSETERLADVVEIKSSSSKQLKPVKRTIPQVNQPVKKMDRPKEENAAIELLKKIEEESRKEPMKNVDPENKKVATEIKQVPAANLAQNKGEKNEITSVVDVVNYMAGKVSGDNSSKLIAINDTRQTDGSNRKSYQIDLGIIKLSRVKNTK